MRHGSHVAEVDPWLLVIAPDLDDRLYIAAVIERAGLDCHGQGRGGFYTYQTLENIVGCRITNATEILPDHQHPAVGESILLHPTSPPMRIAMVDPPNALVLFGSPADVSAEQGGGLAESGEASS